MIVFRRCGVDGLILCRDGFIIGRFQILNIPDVLAHLFIKADRLLKISVSGVSGVFKRDRDSGDGGRSADECRRDGMGDQ